MSDGCVNDSTTRPPQTPDSNISITSRLGPLLNTDTVEKIVPIRNILLIKHITENNDKELSLVGTFIQELPMFDIEQEIENLCDNDNFIDMTGSTRQDIETLSKRLFFDYRVNDITADEDNGWVKTRRVEVNNGKAKKTFQVIIPLEIEVEYDHFPFKVVTASAMIELSSSAIRDRRRRPNLLLSKDHKAANVVLQRVHHMNSKYSKDRDTKTIKNEKKDDPVTMETLVKKMDKSKSFNFIRPFPEVVYLYDKKKKYCPKFKVSFYMKDSGANARFVQIVFPILLIAIMNTIQVIDNASVDNTDFLSNAATFALTAVFILPSIISDENRPSIWTTNNIYIISIFVGLALSSIPPEMANTSVPAYVGMGLIWVSFSVPIIGSIHYYRHCSSLKSRLPEQKDRYTPVNIEQSRDDLCTVNDMLVESFFDCIYKMNSYDKFVVVHG